MTIYIALFRGINVGKNNRIKMADLKQLLLSMGLRNVQTYIQSGNVLFEADEEVNSLRDRMEQEVEQAFGFSVRIMLRTAAELDWAIGSCPFPVNDLQEGESIQVAFLSEHPAEEAIGKLLACNNEMEQCHFEKEIMYLFLRKSILDSKIATKLPKLGVQATVRNWKTTTKLDSMAKSMS